jgi:hypothetical protein
MTKANFSNKNLGAGGAIIISAWISHKDNGALSVLSLGSDNLRAAGGKALAEGLKGNQAITELNIAGNFLTLNDGNTAYDDMSGVTAVANTISGMGAISQFTFSGDSRDSKPVTMETSMVEADFSGKHLGVSGATMLLAFLPKCT